MSGARSTKRGLQAPLDIVPLSFSGIIGAHLTIAAFYDTISLQAGFEYPRAATHTFIGSW